MHKSTRPSLNSYWIAFLLLIALPLPKALAQDDLFVVHFSTGPAWDTTRTPNEQVTFAEHSANLSRLRSEGVIRFGGRYDEFGMIILRSSSLENATAMIETDPGVKSGLFVFRIAPIRVFYPWKD